MRHRQSSKSQRALLKSFEGVQDLLPETPARVWRAWVRLGRQTEERLSSLRDNWKNSITTIILFLGYGTL